jgi:hypothetical protein
MCVVHLYLWGNKVHPRQNLKLVCRGAIDRAGAAGVLARATMADAPRRLARLLLAALALAAARAFAPDAPRVAPPRAATLRVLARAPLGDVPDALSKELAARLAAAARDVSARSREVAELLDDVSALSGPGADGGSSLTAIAASGAATADELVSTLSLAAAELADEMVLGGDAGGAMSDAPRAMCVVASYSLLVHTRPRADRARTVPSQVRRAARRPVRGRRAQRLRDARRPRAGHRGAAQARPPGKLFRLLKGKLSGCRDPFRASYKEDHAPASHV